MCREECPVSPILPTANEEGLDRHRSRLACEREHIGVAQTLGVNRLAALDIGQRPQPIAIDRGELEILAVCRLGHGPRQAALYPNRFAGEELLRFADELTIILDADPPDARRRAALDLVEQARPAPVGE